MGISDLRHAWRTIIKMPVLAVVVVVSLGAGIGVNTAVFSWLQAVVLRPLPGVADAGRFHFVEARAETGSYPGVSWLEYRDLQERLRSFPELLAFRMMPLNVGETAQSQRAYGLLVSGNYFSALGVKPAFGRFMRPDEVSRPNGEPVIVIRSPLVRVSSRTVRSAAIPCWDGCSATHRSNRRRRSVAGR